MKWLFTILMLLVTQVSVAQTDSVCYSSQQVLNISNHIRDLEQRDSINEILLTEYKTKTSLHRAIHLTDSLMLNYKNEEIELLNERVKLYQEQAKLNKPKWYERKLIMFISGMGTVWMTWYVTNITP